MDVNDKQTKEWRIPSVSTNFPSMIMSFSKRIIDAPHIDAMREMPKKRSVTNIKEGHKDDHIAFDLLIRSYPHPVRFPCGENAHFPLYPNATAPA